MNIFALHQDPRLAAIMHCDQHLNKMIVESAQMLSTALRGQLSPGTPELQFLMKPAYAAHPCTVWVARSLHNAAWLAELAKTLELQRDSSRENAATPVIRLVASLLEDLGADWHKAEPRIFCGPASLQQPTTEERYQAFYRLKAESWYGKPHAMSYHGRVLPEFLHSIRDRVPASFPYVNFSEQQLLELWGV